jgi:hypothetical protein
VLSKGSGERVKKNSSPLTMSIQFWIDASTMTASQIMMGIGMMSSLR